MKKVYGYKEKDLISLAEFLQTRGGGTLTSTFKEFATQSGKRVGTVRNLYYALAKLSASDEEFCKEHLGGKAIRVAIAKPFCEQEEKALLKKILCAIKEGKSVRKGISELACGDAKKELRYQNKYRSLIKNKKELVKEAVKEIKEETGVTVTIEDKKRKLSAPSPVQTERLKREIDGLVERIAFSARKENRLLKERIQKLEEENANLSEKLRIKRYAAEGFFLEKKNPFTKRA